MKKRAETKIGILGGGQLGRMLLQVAINYPVETYVMDAQEDAPARNFCDHFVQGSILSEDQVVEFGKDLDVITIEIENVSIAALYKLKEMGKRVIPDPQVLEIIQDKAKQNEFYNKNNIPTPLFSKLESRSDLNKYLDKFPLVQKLRKFGYDGKGVQILDNENDVAIAFDEPSIIEEKIEIEKEIGVIVIKSTTGEIVQFPPTEMVFDPVLNLVDYLISPADLPSEIHEKVKQVASQTVEAFQWPGIYAIELFLSKNGAVYVNETAPRTHNSGHASIEGNFSSQFEQHLRILLGLSPGSTKARNMSLMYNIIGPAELNGKPLYDGLQAISKLEYVYLHLYGKSETRPGRKLGHVTILGDSKNELLDKLNMVKSTLSIKV